MGIVRKKPLAASVRKEQMQRATEQSAHEHYTRARLTLNLSPILALKEARANAKKKHAWGGDDPFSVYNQTERDHRWGGVVQPDITGSKRCA